MDNGQPLQPNTSSDPQPQTGQQPEPAVEFQDTPLVSWEASEYVHHEKSSSWYLGLAGVIILISATLFLIFRDWASIVVVVIMGVALGIYAGRPPQVQRYSLSPDSLLIGQRRFYLDEFRSFTATEEGPAIILELLPLKRFALPVSVYASSEDAEKIVSVLGQSLPQEERRRDLVDDFLRRIRF